MNDNTKGILLVCLGTTLFSSKSILIQWAFNAGASVDQLMLIRMLIALPFYFVAGLWAWKKLEHKPPLSAFALIALPGFACYHIASYLDMWALQFLTAGLERIILFSYPIIVVVIQAFRGHSINRVQWLGLATAYLGVLLFFRQDVQLYQSTSMLAVSAVFVAALLTAYYVLASQKFGRQYSSDFFTAVAMGITGLTIPSHFVVMNGFNLSGIGLDIWAYGAFLSIVLTVFASFALNRGIGLAGAQKGSVAGMLGPMITLLMAAWILNQPFTLMHGLAVAVTVLGVSLVTQSERLGRFLSGNPNPNRNRA